MIDNSARCFVLALYGRTIELFTMRLKGPSQVSRIRAVRALDASLLAKTWLVVVDWTWGARFETGDGEESWLAGLLALAGAGGT